MTPSQRIVAEAMAVEVVVDAGGRRLEVRRPGALDRLRLFKALGPSLSQNDRYVGYAMLAMCVASIDDVPVPQPGSEGQLEGLIERLGDAGMVAVAQGLGLADAEPGKRSGAAGLESPAALQHYTQSGDLRDALFLVKHGVPLDVAFSLCAEERTAWVVTFGQLDGLTWDFGAGRWS